MPKNKFQDVVFTFLMASVMVYGMVVYNLTLNTGTVTEAVFVSAFRELPVMIPAAFVLEFLIVGKIAKKLAFKVIRPDDRPQFITYAVSIRICCIMCPVMSLIAVLLFKAMLPPESRMICREMDNPMPLPPSLVVKNGTKICTASSGGMVGPLLLTSIITDSSGLQ